MAFQNNIIHVFVFLLLYTEEIHTAILKFLAFGLNEFASLCTSVDGTKKRGHIRMQRDKAIL